MRVRGALLPTFGLFLCGLLAPLLSLLAQDRLKTLPAYPRFERLSREISGSVKSGAISVTWTNDSQAFDYSREGKWFRYDIVRKLAVELPKATNSSAASAGERRRRTAQPERGRQWTNALSPDGFLMAIHRDRNVFLSDTNGSNVVAITRDGSATNRVKFGSANWVYGEELYQSTAMWWSTNSRFLAFYRFEETGIPDYHLALNQTRLQTKLDAEPYMKPGATNPVVDLVIHDRQSGHNVTVDVRSGKPFSNDVVGHYVYGVSWTADGKELLFHRTNRRQNIMEFCAANPATGEVRVVFREEWPASWTENIPPVRFFKDGQRFLVISERTGWRNLYLHHLDGRPGVPITQHTYEVEDIVRIDEASETVFYTARSAALPLRLQLHRVRLDGSDDRRLTDPTFHHIVDVAPDGRHFIDIAQTHDTPPTSRLVDADGLVMAELAASDTTKFRQLGLKPVELLSFKAADGQTDLYGMLHFPSDFSRWKKYPLLVSVYAGPATTGARETFTLPNVLTELGFLVATFDSRSASGRGKRFLDSIYQKLGTVEIDDQAAGVKSLWDRRYVDKTRVGIFGTSYGGTASALALMKHPQVFHAAAASSGVMDFRNYDSIYTERYMWIPQDNAAAYNATAPQNFITNLTGRLLLFYGTADNNVHPANTLQLVQALQRAGKSFDLQVGPDQGHASVNRDRMMEFFIDALAEKPPKLGSRR